MPTHPPELRPYRVAVYIVFFAFTLFFIGSVIRSVWLDLYGQPASVSATKLSLERCTDEVDALRKMLDARAMMPLTPHTPQNRDKFEAEWDRFTRVFEDRLHRVQTECIDQEPPGATSAVRDALSTSVERLDTLRQHLARCGQEGEREREAVSAAIDQLRTSTSTNP